MKEIKFLLIAFLATTLIVSCNSSSSTEDETAEDMTEVIDGADDAKEKSNEPVASGTAYKLDTDNSSISWIGKKVTGKHNGSLGIQSGNIMIDGGKLVGGTVNMDMASIMVEDLKAGEGKEDLEGHLKSDDFFGVGNHPVSTFKINSISEGGEGDATHTVTGSLTIKGVSNEVMFPAMVSMEEGKALISGEAKVDRTAYGIKYGSGKFFDNLGDKMIKDNFTIEFNVCANI